MSIGRGARVWLAVAGLAALVVAIYSESFLAIVKLWTLSAYAHCFLVFPIAFYLLWRRRQALAAIAIEPSWPGLALVCGLAVAWFVGRAIALQALEHAAAIAAIPAMVLAVMGTRFLRAALLPMVFLLLAAPVGEFLIPVLMEVTAAIASLLLGVVGIPVYREGMFISLPGGDFEVAEVCSGLKYLLASLPLALLFASWAYRRTLHRVVFVAVTVGVFIVGNGLRAFIVMIVASGSDLRYFAGQDHVVFGNVLFVALLALVCWVGWKYADPPEAAKAIGPADSHAGSAVRSIAVAAAAAASLSVGSAAHAWRVPVAGPAPTAPRLPALTGCTGPGEWAADWTPVLLGASLQTRATYRCGEIEVHMLVAAYRGTNQGHELASNANVLVPQAWSSSGSRADAQLDLGADRTLLMNEIAIARSSRALFAWYWYSVNDEPTRTPRGVKVREALGAIFLKPTVSRAYLVAATGPADRIEALRGPVIDLAREVWHAREAR
ncbi:MAG: exosortase A [Gammaproteobacteria bacterium]